MLLDKDQARQLVLASISKPEGVDGCWFWKGTPKHLSQPLGRTLFGTKRVSPRSAIYRLANGDYDLKLYLCRTCHTKDCINPQHLFLGSSPQAVFGIEDGHCTHCKTLVRMSLPQKDCTIEAHSKGWKHRLDRRRKREYGLAAEAFETMLKEQHNACAICGSAFGETRLKAGHRKAVVDHDHGTGLVRRLLCSKCNSILGLANDDPSVLSNAIKYLESF